MDRLQAVIHEPGELIAQLQEVAALLAHEAAYPILPAGERWAGTEARLILRRLLEPVSPTLALAAEALAGAGGGVALRLPGGFKGYGGAPVCFAPSADGAYMFAQCCAGPLGFGMYCFRQVGAGPAEQLTYGPLMPGRGVFELGGDGILYVTGTYDGATTCVAYVVPGYSRFTPNGPMPVPIPQVVPVVDADARRLAGEAKESASNANKKAEQATASAKNAQTTANQALELAQQPATGLDVGALKNELWNDPWYRSDMLYYWLSPGVISPGVTALIGAIAIEAVKAAAAAAPPATRAPSGD